MPDVRELKAHLQSQRQYLQSLMENRLRRRYEMLLHYHRLTETTGPKYKSRVIKDRLHATQRRLKIVSGKRVSIEELKIKKYAAKLETLSPYRILSRGYTYIDFCARQVTALRRHVCGRNDTGESCDLALRAESLEFRV